jgi:hypothetical protein
VARVVSRRVGDELFSELLVGLIVLIMLGEEYGILSKGGRQKICHLRLFIEHPREY